MGEEPKRTAAKKIKFHTAIDNLHTAVDNL